MKIRKDFVTNSSSSSFVMVFKNEEEYQEFKERCEWMDYMEVYKLIDGAREHSPNKEEIKKIIFDYYAFEEKNEILKHYVKDPSRLSYFEKEEILGSHEFQEELKERVEENEKYQEDMGYLEENEIVIYGVAWDTDGGLLGWCIRNGFLRDEFYQWCILNWNVG